MLLWGIPLIPHLATSFVRQGCDRFIINNYYTIEDVGIFSLALNLSNVIAIFGSGFNQSNSINLQQYYTINKIILQIPIAMGFFRLLIQL